MPNTIDSFLRPLCLLLLAPALPACDVDDPTLDDAAMLDDEFDDELDDDTAFRIGGLTTGRRLNTNGSGQHLFDEIPLDNTNHEGVSLLGIDYFPFGVGNGPSEPVDPSTIIVDGTALHAMTVYGQPLAHHDFNGTEWHISTPTGDYDLLVEATHDAASGTALYEFRWRPYGTSEEPQPTCLMPGEEPLTTAAVYRDLDVHPDGSMNPHPNLLNIGCIAGAVGKASLWGYRPDAGDLLAQYGTSAVYAFEAAVRMLRADYCGDGVSWTQPGTPVYLKDRMGINDSISGLWVWPGPQTEAVWGWAGAMCVDLPRIHSGLWVQPSCNGWTLPSCSPNVDSWYWSLFALFQTASDL